MINRYFNPSIYNKNGFMDFIVSNEYQFNLVESVVTNQVIYVQQYAIDYYNFRWLDTSQITVIDLATKLFDYKVN